MLLHDDVELLVIDVSVAFHVQDPYTFMISETFTLDLFILAANEEI